MKLYHVSSGGHTRLGSHHTHPGSDPNSVLGTFWGECPVACIDLYANHPYIDGIAHPPQGSIFCADVTPAILARMAIRSGYDDLFATTVSEDAHAQRQYFITLKQKLLAQGKTGIIFDDLDDERYYVFFDLNALNPRLIPPDEYPGDWELTPVGSHHYAPSLP